RRLGHFGFNVDKMDEGLHFYSDLLGFRVSDEIDFGRFMPNAAEIFAGLGPTKGYFMRYGGAHHPHVLFPRPGVGKHGPLRRGHPARSAITINQITWQVGSLGEVGRAIQWLGEQNVPFHRAGRDMPGSNWHVYPEDPDGHTNELYYGIEQVGWDGYSKPRSMYNRGFRERPPLPQMAEMDEVQQALDSGVALNSGYRHTPQLERTFDVDGILLERPFKV